MSTELASKPLTAPLKASSRPPRAWLVATAAIRTCSPSSEFSPTRRSAAEVADSLLLIILLDSCIEWLRIESREFIQPQPVTVTAANTEPPISRTTLFFILISPFVRDLSRTHQVFLISINEPRSPRAYAHGDHSSKRKFPAERR